MLICPKTFVHDCSLKFTSFYFNIKKRKCTHTALAIRNKLGLFWNVFLIQFY